MTLTLDELNRLPEPEAAERFRTCCGSARWVDAMVRARPYPSLAALIAAGDAAWRQAEPADWEEAFAAHPRIGEKTTDPRSRAEQSAARTGDDETRQALAEGNAAYERRFGRRYLVCATGRTAPELLRDLTARLGNDPATELAIAAGEQAKITQIRLRRMLGGGG